MHTPAPHSASELSILVQAITANQADDAMTNTLTDAQWTAMNGYLQPLTLAPGQILIDQGATDRGVYWVESGSLSVHYEDDKGRVLLAMVAPGSAVGEGAFFTHNPRNATVQAAAPCKVWCLTPIRFTELANRHPAIALAIAMALGSLLGRRLVNKPKRVAVT